MNAPRSTEERISLWLEEEAQGPLPDRVLEASFERTRGSRQVRASAWRPSKMTRPIPAFVAVGAAAILLVIGVSFLRPSSDPGGVGGTAPTPTPSPATSPAEVRPTPMPSLDTSTWETYTSPRYGLSIAHPADWTVEPGDHDWSLEIDAAWPNTAADKFSSPDGHIALAAWSVPVEPGTDLNAWIQAYCEKNTEPCTEIQARAEPVYAEPRDRHPGTLVAFQDDIQAFFLNADRIYVVASWRPAGEFDSRRLIEAFALTMCLGCGEDGSSPTPS
jgi:hypothetical protein